MSEKQITPKSVPPVPISDLLPSFPSREAFEDYLARSPRAWDCYLLLPADFKQTLINYCIGKSGPKITYDSIFRKIFDPEVHPHRLESLLSAILGHPVHIVNVLSRKGTQINEHTSFVIMDVLIQTSDGTYANVEMQKIGYSFPISRADCYASDVIMRQYADRKHTLGQEFTFHDLQKVYCIVLMEESPSEFHTVRDKYIHRRTAFFDTGIYKEDAGLHEDLFICIDSFHEIVHTITKGSNILDAWLTFLCANDLQSMGALVEAFPEFIPIYQEIRDFVQDPKELMNMLSEELYIMDKNLEREMVITAQAEARAMVEKARAEAMAEARAVAKAEVEAAAKAAAETATKAAEAMAKEKLKYSVAILAYRKHSPAEIAQKLSLPLEEVERILNETDE